MLSLTRICIVLYNSLIVQIVLIILIREISYEEHIVWAVEEMLRLGYG